jgi:hypothetical protein
VRAVSSVIFTLAIGLAACATIPDEEAAIIRGCRAIKARFGPEAVRCSNLRAKLTAGDTQWVVLEDVPADTLHATGAAISKRTGRVFNVWRE